MKFRRAADIISAGYTMGVLRRVLLAGAQSRWLKERATRYWFVRRTVSRFMPGETLDDALGAAAELKEKSLGTVFTLLGENVTDSSEAESVAEHYLEVQTRVRALGLGTEVSVKLTQLGLDLDRELCYANLKRIIEHENGSQPTRAGRVVWIDMEASQYVDRTLEVYRRARRAYPNVGVCLQAYLYRTAQDLAALMPLGPAIRLVKGAYQEPPDRAYPRKKDVDENYFALACKLLGEEARRNGARAALATHDRKLIARIVAYADSNRIARDRYEFQMLYGIQREEQARLAREGWRTIVLVSYGIAWFPWFMRRLAERPANVLFVARNLFTG